MQFTCLTIALLKAGSASCDEALRLAIDCHRAYICLANLRDHTHAKLCCDCCAGMFTLTVRRCAACAGEGCGQPGPRSHSGHAHARARSGHTSRSRRWHAAQPATRSFGVRRPPQASACATRCAARGFQRTALGQPHSIGQGAIAAANHRPHGPVVCCVVEALCASPLHGVSCSLRALQAATHRATSGRNAEVASQERPRIQRAQYRRRRAPSCCARSRSC